MSNEQKYMCEICGRRFTRSYNLNNHIKIKHDYVSLKYSCYLCRKNFKKQDDYLKHIDNHKEVLSFVLCYPETKSLKNMTDKSQGH